MPLHVVPPNGPLLRVLSNPHRIRLLALVAGQAMTAVELAEETGLRRTAVEYHLRRLAHGGLVEVVAGDGASRRYRRVRSSPRWQIDDDRERAMALRALAADLRRRWADEDVGQLKVVYDGEFWVDPQTWGGVCEQVMDAVQRLREAARAPHAEGTIRVSATATFFRMVSDGQGPQIALPPPGPRPELGRSR